MPFDSAINSKPRNNLRQRTPRDEASPKGLNRSYSGAGVATVWLIANSNIHVCTG
jgi:hypothetical protein